MEVYINDMLVNSSNAKDHVAQLQGYFTFLNKLGMTLNPTKCSFEIASSKLIGYLVTK